MDYLLKTEPTVYSFADLEREKTTIWDGVTNPTAVKHLREMRSGERLVIYHTGDEKIAVGTASVVSVDASDPKVPEVKIKVGNAIAKPKALAEIKARAAFAESPLVRQGRLSVVPLTAAQYAGLGGGRVSADFECWRVAAQARRSVRSQREQVSGLRRVSAISTRKPVYVRMIRSVQSGSGQA